MPTYNHENYVSQAIESVLGQTCNFSYKLVITDDSSTDDTSAICEKYQAAYPDKILFLKSTSNQGLIANYKKVLDNCSGKYVAILESDDYWIDSFKLQKQVDLMESDSEIGVVHSNCVVLYEDGTTKQTTKGLMSNDFHNLDIEKYMREGVSIVPVTAIFRRSLYQNHIDIDWAVKNQLWTFDSFLWLGLIKHTKVIHMSDFTGVYRILKSSISNTNVFAKIESKFHTTLLIKQHYLDKYKLTIPFSQVVTREFLFITQRALEHKLYEKARSYGENINVHNLKTLKVWLFSKSPILYPVFKFDKFLNTSLSTIKQKLLPKHTVNA
jgi:glycosyltransferase involved in cell wall biosynthesis